jgi:hypothetical protein
MRFGGHPGSISGRRGTDLEICGAFSEYQRRRDKRCGYAGSETLVALPRVCFSEPSAAGEPVPVDYSLISRRLAFAEDPNAYAVDVFFVCPSVYQGPDLQDIIAYSFAMQSE